MEKKQIECPKCKARFSISYARVFACSGCPSSATGSCGYIKCPECGFEFPYY
jgi:DNA-directed RNA polymerase subunit RPC12/RpoP